MEATWGHLPTLAQDRAISSVQGRVGATAIPGTTEGFNPRTGQWEYPLNVVGNTNGGTWHCVISRLKELVAAALFARVLTVYQSLVFVGDATLCVPARCAVRSYHLLSAPRWSFTNCSKEIAGRPSSRGTASLTVAAAPEAK